METKTGYWHLMRVLPYRTMENVIDGVVITFQDIQTQKTALEKIKVLNREIENARNYSENIVNTVRESILILDSQMKVISANQSFYKKFQVIPETTEGKFIYELDNGQWNIPRLRELLEKIIPENSIFEDFRIEHNFKNIGPKTLLLNARKITGKEPAKEMVLLAIEDINSSQSGK